MAKLFLTKVWGFSPETYPALGFSSVGARNKFLKESAPGDWVLMAGTRRMPTKKEHQGRLLGMVQLGKDTIDVEKTLKSMGNKIPDNHYTDDGKYRWPYGLPMLKAQRFTEQPELSELFGSFLPGMEWVSYALDIEKRLGTEIIAKIESLQIEPATIIDAPVIVKQRERNDALVLNKTGGPTGPGPSQSRKASNRVPGVAFAYLLELHGGQKKDIYKVGYSSNPEERTAELNRGLITGVTGYVWKLILKQIFKNEKQAYAFEQILHKRLARYRVVDEQEIYSVPVKHIKTAWQDELYLARWADAE